MPRVGSEGMHPWARRAWRVSNWPFVIGDLFLQLLVRPSGRRVCYVSDPDYIGNSFHMFRRVASSRDGIEHCWLLRRRDRDEQIQADFERFTRGRQGHTLKLVDRHSARGYLTMLGSRTIFHCSGIYRWTRTAVRGRRVVSLWHGMPIKVIGAHNKVSARIFPTFGTDHVATSTMFKFIIASAFDSPADEVIVTNMPRCDALTHPDELTATRADVAAFLGIDPERRFVLWMPTYRTRRRDTVRRPGTVGFRTFLDDLGGDVLNALDAAAQAHDCAIVVKLHPMDALNDWEGELAHSSMRLITSNEWLQSGIELYDFLSHSAGLLSDVSSVLIDYLATTRPIAIVGFDPSKYARDVVFPVRVLQDSHRFTDLASQEAIEEFFAQAVTGAPQDPGPADVAGWLYERSVERGCDTVLDAVGL